MASWPTLLPIRSLPFSSCSSSFDNSASPFYYYYYSHIHQSMLLFLFIFTLSLSFLSVLILSLHSKRINYNPIKSLIKQIQKNSALYEASVDNINNNDDNNKDQMDKQLGHGSSPTRLIRTILLEVLPSDSPKSADIFKGDGPYKNGLAMDGEGGFGEEDEEEDKKKKRKKRAKKKRPDSNNGAAGEGKTKKDNKKEELVCLYPFKTSSSAIQRKIKQQYDQLVKSHESNGLTLAQVGQFVNSLVEAKKELQHRSEVIQRKFTITKALLLKADRSSFDRLHQQIYKLELEQKRLEEDAFVYNWLQQQLKLSSAYKKMLEIGACMEMEDKPHKQVESTDNEFSDISFEELLAQEKKDAFWQRNGRSRSYSVSGQRFC